jgi:DNA-binding IclR family transcriptional regulator
MVQPSIERVRPSGPTGRPLDDASPPTSRVVAVLDFLSRHSDGATASEAGRRLGITTSTAAAILAALDAAGYVERSPDKSYRLGPGLLPLVTAVQRRFPLSGVAEGELERLSATVRCGVTLDRLASDHVAVLYAVGSRDHRPLGVAPGDHFPIGPPYGAIAVAWRSDDEVDDWLNQAPFSPEERAHERAVMRDIRTRGFGAWTLGPRSTPLPQRIQAVIDALATDPSSRALRDQLTELFAVFGRRGYTSEELTERSRLAVGYVLAPVFGDDAQPRYQIDLHLLRPSMTRKEFRAAVDQLLTTADTLTRAIGGTTPPRQTP